MYGAILGDIIGSPYEFDHNNSKTKDFPLFSRRSEFTDDSVMTLAVGEALMKCDRADLCAVRREVIACMRKWGRRYPHAGYGGRFGYWLREPAPKPYHSFGNGSAMRVSAVGWLYDTLPEVLDAAKATADVTHNHPEGIKGAQVIAAAIFLARTGHTKDEIRSMAEEMGYRLNRSCDEIRPHYFHQESCQATVPEALTAFLESNGFEDAIRLAVSLGGDSDTLAAITGSIAEAFYGIDPDLRREAEERLGGDLRAVLLQLDALIRSKN